MDSRLRSSRPTFRATSTSSGTGCRQAGRYSEGGWWDAAIGYSNCRRSRCPGGGPNHEPMILLRRQTSSIRRTSSGSSALRGETFAVSPQHSSRSAPVEPASFPELPPMHQRDRWQKIAASQIDGSRRMAVHLEDDRRYGEHEAGNQRRSPTSRSYDGRWRHDGPLLDLCHVEFPFKICRPLEPIA